MRAASSFELARLRKAPIAIEAVERIDALFAIEARDQRHGRAAASCRGRAVSLDYHVGKQKGYAAPQVDLRCDRRARAPLVQFWWQPVQAKLLMIIIVRVFSPGFGLRKSATFSSTCTMRSSSTS